MSLALFLVVGMFVGLVGMGWLLWQILLQQGRLLLRLEAVEEHLTEVGHAAQPGHALPARLGVGTPAPSFRLISLQGEMLTLESFRAAGKPVLLLFTDPGCASCTALLRGMGRELGASADQLTLAVISRGSAEANLSQVHEHGIQKLLLQADREVQASYHVFDLPAGVLVRLDGTIGSPPAQGADALRDLVASAISPFHLRSVPMARAQDQRESLSKSALPPVSPSDPADRVLAVAKQAHAPGLPGSLLQDATAPPLVSVVLPVYNGERYLRAAVQSLLRQTLRPIEIIVINDGSTDQTAQILSELAATDPRVRPVHQAHLGEPRTRNAGLALAHAKYIAVHDADDLSFPDRLSTQYAYLEREPEVALVASPAAIMNETGQVTGRLGSQETNPAHLAARLSKVNCLIHGSVMLRRTALEAVGGYREAFALAPDYDLWLRLAEHFPLGNLADVLYVYRFHPDSVSHQHKPVQLTYVRIAQALAEQRRQTGSDLLEREGMAAFQAAYGARLEEAGRPENRLLLRVPPLPFERSTQRAPVRPSTGSPVHVQVGEAIMEVPQERLWAFPGGCYYEKNVAFWLQKLVSLLPRKVVYDLGANHGYYCLLLAPLVRRIYAFEPVSSTYAVLQKNIAANHLDQVTAYPLGIFQSAGSAEISLARSSGGNSLFAQPLPTELIGREVVRLTSLDELIAEEGLEPPGLVKIDIEGGELFALKGARETIKTAQPIIVAAYGERLFRATGYSRRDLLRELQEQHYRLCGIPKAAEDLRLYPQEACEEVPVATIIAVPEGMQEILEQTEEQGGSQMFPAL